MLACPHCLSLMPDLTIPVVDNLSARKGNRRMPQKVWPASTRPAVHSTARGLSNTRSRSSGEPSMKGSFGDSNVQALPCMARAPQVGPETRCACAPPLYDSRKRLSWRAWWSPGSTVQEWPSRPGSHQRHIALPLPGVISANGASGQCCQSNRTFRAPGVSAAGERGSVVSL